MCHEVSNVAVRDDTPCPLQGPLPGLRPHLDTKGSLGLARLGADMTIGAQGTKRRILSIVAYHSNVHDACMSIMLLR